MDLYIFIVAKNVYASLQPFFHASSPSPQNPRPPKKQSLPPATEVELAFSASFVAGTWIYNAILADGSWRKAC